MRQASFFAAVAGVAVAIGIFAANASAGDMHFPTSFDNRVDVMTVGHPGFYPRHDIQHEPWPPGHGQPHHPHGLPSYRFYSPLYGPPAVIYPFPAYPPVYPRHRHVCGPGCGCGHVYGPPSTLYYRGNGWGFSFSF